MPVELDQAARAQRGVQLLVRHPPEPCPRHRTKRHFERARPIDAAQEGVLLDPRLELPEGFVEVLAAPALEPCLRQHRQMLMTIQLPYHFVIADAREIQIRHAPEILEAAGHAMRSEEHTSELQ